MKKKDYWHSTLSCLVMVCSMPVLSNEENAHTTKLNIYRAKTHSALHYDTSTPLRKIPTPFFQTIFEDSVNQNYFFKTASLNLILNFEGMGLGFKGPNGIFKIEGVPSDTVSAIGPHHYIQQVNSSITIFNKSGIAIYGPVKTNTVWKGFGGSCEFTEDGQGNIIYDHLAKRWLISQLHIISKPYLECIAVSSSEDPLGSYHRYSFEKNFVPDSPRVGLWPDAYYYSFNLYNDDGAFDHSSVCAYERDSMLKGLTAREQCIDLRSEASLRLSSLSGDNTPPFGSPQYLLNLGSNSLKFWTFYLDWAGLNTELRGPIRIPVNPFSNRCEYNGCIPQLGSQQKLDSVSDRLIRRIVYRNFGDHESLIATHTVEVGQSTGIRWYEIRNPGSKPTIFQQGTYAPDSNFRWLANAAINKNGSIALGYSISSPNMHPGIRLTGRIASDPLGTMGQGEGLIIDGTGSQEGFESWGSTSAMDLDPTDNCTFYFSSEYLAENGSFNWHTRVASFRLSDCENGG